MRARLSENPEGVVEIPTYMDDINGVIYDQEGSKDMARVGEKTTGIIEEHREIEVPSREEEEGDSGFEQQLEKEEEGARACQVAKSYL